MFAESTPLCLIIRNIVLYIYIMNIPFAPPFFHLFLFLIYILYLYTEKRILFPAHSLPFLSAHSFPLYTLLLYTLYIERSILSRNFLPLSPYFYYTPSIYRMIHTFPAPFYLSYKVNTFTPPFSLSF